MPLTSNEQKLFDFAVSSLPPWFVVRDRTREIMQSMAKIFGEAYYQADAYFDESLILQAVGIYLDQHARDRGTFRQTGELDASLRIRLRTVEDAVTLPVITTQVQAIIDSEGIVGAPAFVELRLDRAYFGDFTSDTGTGGVFTNPSGNTFLFTPTDKFLAPPRIGDDIVFSGANSAGNDGTFEVDAIVDDAVQYENASGVAEGDGAVSWTWQKRDPSDDAVIDGFNKSYLSRGFRVGSEVWTIVIILPFGCSTTTQSAVREMLRQKKAAGVKAIVECRENP